MAQTLVYLAKLVSTGRGVSWLTDPYVDIEYDGIDISRTQEYRIENAEDTVIIFARAVYHEATTLTDTPTFSMIVKDENGDLVEEIVWAFRDTPCQFDQRNRKLIYKTSGIDFSPGEKKVFNIELEVKLDIRNRHTGKIERTLVEWTRESVTVIVEADRNLEVEDRTVVLLPSMEMGAVPSLSHEHLANIMDRMAVGPQGVYLDVPPLLPPSFSVQGFPVAGIGMVTTNAVMQWINGISSKFFSDAESEAIVQILGEERIEVDWKDEYSIIVRAEITGPSTFFLRAYEIMEDGEYVELSESDLYPKYIDYHESETPAFHNHSFSESRNWQWSEERPTWFDDGSYGMTHFAVGPYRKTFLFRAGLAELNQQENPDAIICQKEVTVVVTVPLNKRLKVVASTALDYAADLTGAGSLVASTAAGALIGSAIPAIGTVVGAFGGFIIGLIGNVACSTLADQSRGMATDALSNCARNFDPDYLKLVDYESLLTEQEITGEAPEQVLKYFNPVRRITALSEAMDISFTRYLTARLEHLRNYEDLALNASENQFDHADIMFRVMEGEMLSATGNFKKLLNYLSENEDSFSGFVNFINEDDEAGELAAGALDDLRNNGLSDEQRQVLEDMKLSSEQIARLEKKITETEIDFSTEYNNLIQELPGRIESIQQNATEMFMESMSFIREMRYIETLPGSDALPALLNKGMLGVKELEVLTSKLGYSHLMEELDFAGEILFADPEGEEVTLKSGLKDIGVLTSCQFLHRCRTPEERRKLAQILDVTDKKVLTWANLADLVRISGVSDYYAVILEECGVDTVKELSRRNPDNLYSTLTDYCEKKELEIIEKSDVEKWISRASEIKPMLEY